MARLENDDHEVFCRRYVGVGKRNTLRTAALVDVHQNTAYAWMERPEVRARIAELSEHLLKDADITAQRVMRELGRLAFADIRSLYGEDGRLVHPHDLDDDAAAAVASIEHKTEYVPGPREFDIATGKMVRTRVPIDITRVKRFDKNPALQTLARHYKLVGDEGDGVNALASALADRLKAARARTAPASDETEGDLT